MRKTFAIIICAIFCFGTICFAGCSALDEEDKTLLNNSYSEVSEYLDSQKETNQELLYKLDEQNEINHDLISKIEDLTTEIGNLKEEKVITQEEIKTELLLKMKAVLFQEKNYRMDETTTTTFKGKTQTESTAVYAYYYDKVLDVQKMVLGERLGINEKLANGTYTTKEYDLTTGLEVQYEPDDIISSVVTMRTSDPLNNMLVAYYDYISNEYDETSQSELKNVVYSITKNGSNVTYRMDFDLEVPTQYYTDPMTLEFTFSDDKLFSYTVKGFSTSCNIVSNLVCEITYDIPDIQVEDYLV